jgi:hypothetical protein
MALFVPQGNQFAWSYSNITFTRPNIAGWGTAHTPSTTASTFSTYATLVAAANITTDVYGILLCFNNNATSATIRNTLVNIGVDTAGGTSFVTRIPELMIGNAAPLNIGAGGVWYYFPLFIPSGSSIGIQAGSTVATAFATAVWLYGRPKNPEAIRTGSYVTAFGTQTGTAWRGTNVTPGTTTEGTIAQIGAATTRDHWWWQAGFCLQDGTATASVLTLDVLSLTSVLGASIPLIDDQVWSVTANEQISAPVYLTNCYQEVVSGDRIHARLQGSTTADTGSNVAVYGLGG